MNTNVIILSSFAVGAGVGGGATYFIVKKRYRALADAEVASVKEVFANIRDISHGGDSDPEAEVEAAGATAVEPTVTDHVPYNRIIKENGYDGSEQPIQDSEVDSREVEAVEVKIDTTTDEIEEVRVEYAEHNPAYQQHAISVAAMYEDRSSGPYLIGIAEFMGECEDFGKTSLTWYAGDNTLVNEDDHATVIDDLRIIGGDRLFTAFGQDQYNTDTLYIRNEESENDYEILLNEGRFRDVALGNTYLDDIDAEMNRRNPRKMRSDG